MAVDYEDASAVAFASDEMTRAIAAHEQAKDNHAKAVEALNAATIKRDTAHVAEVEAHNKLADVLNARRRVTNPRRRARR